MTIADIAKTDLNISLESNDTSAVSLDNTVTVLAGDNLAMFDITIIDNNDSYG